MSIQKTRQEFEAHFSKEFPHLSQHRDENGDYSDFFADGAWCGWQEQQSQIDQLEKELSEARKDAERYRWLREEHNRIDPMMRVSCKMFYKRESANWGNLINADELDVAIDAAMEAK